MLISYSAAKVFKGQFLVPLSVWDTPLGELSGFYMAWSFFGWSEPYSLFIAAVQFIGAVLLLFRRATLMGALLLFPILLNIVLIDVFYSILLSALINAVVLTIMLSIIIASHWRLIQDFLEKMQQEIFLSVWQKRKWMLGIKYVLRVLTIVLPVLLMYYVRYYNNILPTSIDGKWEVNSIEFKNQPKQKTSLSEAETIYFEPDFAYKSGIRQNGQITPAIFSVNEETKEVTITTGYPAYTSIFEGVFVLDENETNLILEGKWQQNDAVLNLSKDILLDFGQSGN